VVRFVGGRPEDTAAYRLPEVAVGQNQYIPIDPSYNNGSLLGFLRMSAGGHVDLTGNFMNHAAYVEAVTLRKTRRGGEVALSDSPPA